MTNERIGVGGQGSHRAKWEISRTRAGTSPLMYLRTADVLVMFT
jgi:hypothetical protein